MHPIAEAYFFFFFFIPLRQYASYLKLKIFPLSLPYAGAAGMCLTTVTYFLMLGVYASLTLL